MCIVVLFNLQHKQKIFMEIYGVYFHMIIICSSCELEIYKQFMEISVEIHLNSNMNKKNSLMHKTICITRVLRRSHNLRHLRMDMESLCKNNCLERNNDHIT